MKSLAIISISLFSASVAIASLSACDDTEATAVVDNAYPTLTDGGADPLNSITVYRAWWLVTVFTDPVAAGTSSDSHRVVNGLDSAYVVLAPGWDKASGTAPTKLIPAKTKTAIGVSSGDVLHITANDENLIGNCAAKQPLTQVDADFITQNIFPNEFAGFTYDAPTCTLTPISDGGITDAASSD
jgi:hypothetical protein